MALRSLPKSLTLASFFTRSLTISSTVSVAVSSRSPVSLLNRLRPLTAVVAELHRLTPADSFRTFATRATSSSLNDPNPNWSNRPPKETILLDGCDFNHWLVVMEPPEPNATRDEIIDGYIKTLAQIVGSEDEARMKIYSVSTRHYFAFGALVSEEDSYKIKELPKVRWVLPDSYLDVRNKDYGGEPFINGQAVPYDEKYHAEWVRNNARANERNRRNDRPRNFDRSRTFDRRRENMQNRQPMNNAVPSTIGAPPNNMNGNPANPNIPGAPPNQNVGGYAPANVNGPPGSYNTTPPNNSGMPQNSNMGYGNVPPNQGGYGNVPPNQGGYGTVPPNQGGYGNVPPNQGGYSNVPPNQGGYGNVPPNQGGYGNVPPNQGGFSAHNARWSQSNQNMGGFAPNQNMRDAVPPNQNMAGMQPNEVWSSNQQTFTPDRDMPGSPGGSNSA